MSLRGSSMSLPDWTKRKCGYLWELVQCLPDWNKRICGCLWELVQCLPGWNKRRCGCLWELVQCLCPVETNADVDVFESKFNVSPRLKQTQMWVSSRVSSMSPRLKQTQMWVSLRVISMSPRLKQTPMWMSLRVSLMSLPGWNKRRCGCLWELIQCLYQVETNADVDVFES